MIKLFGLVLVLYLELPDCYHYVENVLYYVLEGQAHEQQQYIITIYCIHAGKIRIACFWVQKKYVKLYVQYSQSCHMVHMYEFLELIWCR